MSAENLRLGIRNFSKIEDITATTLRELYSDWLEKSKGNAMAPANSIDLLDYAENARNWAIVDVINGGEDFEFRFAGPDLVAFLTLEPTGHRFSDVGKSTKFGDFVRNSRAILSKAASSQRPVLNGPTTTTLSEKSFYTIESLNLPMGVQEVTQIITAIDLNYATDEEA